jgi:protease-4
MDAQSKQTPAEPAFEPLQPANSPQSAVTRPRRSRGVLVILLLLALGASLLLNVLLARNYFGSLLGNSASERFYSGERSARDKIAIITVNGVIMPPYTDWNLKAIKQATDDDDVKGVLLVVDSPGGLVADSHQIYHRLQQISAPSDPSKKKPVYVAMKRMAASGGYYIAMGGGKEGKIYAEPTTWTGSIGVIIPRYNVSKLAEKWDVKVEPLTTGPFKDALSPFRELSSEERAVWQGILDDAFGRFVSVIADNRPSLDAEAVKKLATGQVYTADQALKNGMIDKIGYVDDAIADLKTHLGLESVRVVSYDYRPSLLEILTASGEAKRPENPWKSLLESTVPQAMYLCSWGLGVPGW